MANRTHSLPNSASENLDLQDQLTDLWEIIHRHRALVLTCVVITLGLGALYYLKAPRTYESQSDILIGSKQVAGFRAGEDDRSVSHETVETHALRLQSPLILERAIEAYDLASLPTLAKEEDAVKFIIENSVVTLKDENASVLNFVFRCRDPRDSRDIVRAIAKTYEDYLGEANKKLGKETSELIKQANRILLEQMQANEQTYREFQRTAPLMWRNGQGVNVHHERQSEIETARQELMVERTTLSAKIDAIDASLTAGGISRDAIYYEALGALKPESEEPFDWREFKLAEQEHMAEREAVRQYASLLMGEYVRLMVTRSELLDEFGEGHPNLNSITKRREEVKRMLNGLLTRDMPVMSGLFEDLEEEEEKDYVEIYLQMLRDRLASLDKQIQSLDNEFQAEQKLANVMQDYLLQDQAFRSERDHTKLLFDEVVSQLKEIDIVNHYGGDTASILAEAKFGEQVAPRHSVCGRSVDVPGLPVGVRPGLGRGSIRKHVPQRDGSPPVVANSRHRPNSAYAEAGSGRVHTVAADCSYDLYDSPGAFPDCGGIPQRAYQPVFQCCWPGSEGHPSHQSPFRRWKVHGIRQSGRRDGEVRQTRALDGCRLPTSFVGQALG